MLKNFIICLLAAVFVIPCYASAIEFSADQVMNVKGAPAMTSKLYLKDGKWRMESVVQGMKSISIIRTDKNVSWMLLPDQMIYMENKIDTRQAASFSKTVPGEMKRDKLGRETVNGISCDKYKIVYKEAGRAVTIFSWVSGDGFPVKTSAVDGSWSVELKNMAKGTQNDSLFEIPAGYNRMSLPSMGGIPYN